MKHKTALLVIDLQQLICTGKWAIADSEGTIAHVNSVADRARAAGQPVIFIQHEEDGVMDFNSPGWQLDDRLHAKPDDIRVRKRVPDSFQNTDLQAKLQALRVDKLVVCGAQTEYCVDSTVRGALAHGYPVVLVSDAHSTLDNGVLSADQIRAHHNQTLEHLTSYGPRVTPKAAADVHFDV